MRLCEVTERVEDKVISLQMRFGVLIHTAVVLVIKLSLLKWGSPDQRPTRQGVGEVGRGGEAGLVGELAPYAHHSSHLFLWLRCSCGLRVPNPLVTCD